MILHIIMLQWHVLNNREAVKLHFHVNSSIFFAEAYKKVSYEIINILTL